MENKESAIFEGLNAEQKKAVGSVDGPVLIVAGAGFREDKGVDEQDRLHS